MKFFHVYNEECFKGLEKNGLINKDTGFKIQNAFSVPEDMKFNRLAAKGGKLYNMIREGNIPFYVDRIAGGTLWHDYPLDKNLIREYDELLGDWFLGFQLHESASNRRQDWNQILKATGRKSDYSLEELNRLLISQYGIMPDGTQLTSLSQDPMAVYATLRYAETPEDYFDEIKAMYLRRLDETDGHILPCDSYYMATRLHDQLGMKSFMPEVGCQIPQMRQQLALARGIAKASGKTWGAYYECWREIPGIGYAMPCFNSDPSNEWYLSQELHPDDFSSYGENGGSSRLLQNRIYYHALMSGADYFSEEWGLNCSYSDMQEFSLSDYGKVKKNFINTALELQGVKPIVPFAIVLPKAYGFIEIPQVFDRYELGLHRDVYLENVLTPEQREYFGHVEDVLKLFYAQQDVCGNEGHVLTNSRFGDVFDIIYEDTAAEAMAKYDYLIDATPNGDFAQANAGKGLKILESGDLEALAQTVSKLIPQVMPCYADGLCWLVSADETGRRFVSVFNNEGNERSLEKGDIIHSEADRTVKLTFRQNAQLKVIAESSMAVQVQKADDKTYHITVPAAGFAVFEY